MNKFTVRLFVVFCLSMFCIDVMAQQKNISIQNIAEVKVDELSDEQIKQFISEYKSNGYNFSQVEKMAIQKNMPRAELQKLQQRVEKLESKVGGASQTYDRGVSEDAKDDAVTKNNNADLADLSVKKVFGSELFSNKNLTFEPNLKIPTPANYQLGPDDELIIDIYGYSEVTHKIKVTPEGYLRIPNVGLIQVSGSTIEMARRKIIQNLTKVYSTIQTGETSVNITLGSIRSIKVSILGEVKLPGTYTLSSLATVFNALYASGGPSKNGSFRNIKLIRNGKVITTVDVYEFLMKGEAKGNIRLNDQDVIKVSAYETRIELSGEVKREGLYEMQKTETLKDAINFAGGFTDEAYKERIKVTRNTGKERSVADIQAEKMATFITQTGDVFEVGKILNRFANRVTLEGAVFRPGNYALEQGLTLSKLIKNADGLTEDAFLTRGIIYRLKEDNTNELLSFDLTDIISGKTDIELRREDKVVINSKLSMQERRIVTIRGGVLMGGEYPFAENMRVEDLIVAAGGLTENASEKKIDVARRLKGDGVQSSAEMAEIITYSVNSELKTNSSFVLQPYDIVTVYAIPGYSTQQMITLEGEVQFPGKYAISSKTEKISDVIKRAGGATSYSYLSGAVLIRTRELNEAEKKIRQQKIDALKKDAKDSARVQDIIDKQIGNLTSIVGINLKEIISKPGSEYDLLVQNGDLISIPTKRQTILVSGEVLYPVRIQYKRGKRLSKYVNEAGGFSERALKRGSYVVYANGAVKSTRSFIGFKFYPRLKSGAEIIVPPREERKRFPTGEVVGITTGLATIAVLIISVLK